MQPWLPPQARALTAIDRTCAHPCANIVQPPLQARGGTFLRLLTVNRSSAGGRTCVCRDARARSRPLELEARPCVRAVAERDLHQRGALVLHLEHVRDRGPQAVLRPVEGGVEV